MLVTVFAAAALGFASPHAPALPRGACASPSVSMSAMLSRRDLAAAVAATAVTLAASPLPALADGASTPLMRQKAFAIYGPRILALDRQIRPNSALIADTIAQESNALQLFITSAVPKGDKQKELLKIKSEILAAAQADDAPKAKAALDRFIAVGKIRELSPDNVYALNERRNAGAPPTAEVARQTRREQDFLDRRMPPKPAAPAPAPEPAPAASA